MNIKVSLTITDGHVTTVRLRNFLEVVRSYGVEQVEAYTDYSAPAESIVLLADCSPGLPGAPAEGED